MATTTCARFILIISTLLLHAISKATCCQQQDLNSLLSLKKELTDPGNKLSSWVGRDCCSWQGIACSNRTGRVVLLDLGSEKDKRYLGGKISPSIVGLQHLTYLDLSWNDFDGMLIPGFLGSFPRLGYLNLSWADFGGSVPHLLGNLSRLHYLDLSYNSGLVLDDSRWLSILTSLQYLDLSGVEIPAKSNWLQALNMLPSLVEIHLQDCSLEGIPLSLPQTNFSLLSALDLSYNNINSSLPGWLFNITSLANIRLGGNYFQIVIPDAIKNMSALETLDLSGNRYIAGGLPPSLCELSHLQSLDLSHMSMAGDLATFKGILAGCSKNILDLNLEVNKLEGKLPEWLGEFKNLQSLDLSDNNFSGPIPIFLGRLLELEVLDISWNHLNGTIPESFGGLVNLVELDLSRNYLEGSISESHFAKLKRLRHLDISSNLLSVEVSSDWVPPFQLDYINLGSCQLGPQFPSWMRTQVNCSWLNMSNCGINDSVPKWFWELSSIFTYLELSHNSLTGEVPSLTELRPPPNTIQAPLIDLSSNLFKGPVPLFSRLTFILDLSNNSFAGFIPPNIGNIMPNLYLLSLSRNSLQGAIPLSICSMTSFRVLDLSRNNFSGEIPNCWNSSSSLEILDVSNNNLEGKFPRKICHITSLQSLHVRNNSLHGDLPVFMKGCNELVILDLGNNKFTGKIPAWIGQSFRNLKFLSLSSNNFTGHIPHQLSDLTDLQVLDLSHNNLTGVIPAKFGNFSAMKNAPKGEQPIDGALTYIEQMALVIKNIEDSYMKILSLVTTLDLSENTLSGFIPEELSSLHGLLNMNLSGNRLDGGISYEFGQMQQLESLDLSRNQLSGPIPASLSNLTFLESLNLSYNNLSGRIPSGNQFSSFTDPSIYIGNQDLCGFPLANCPTSQVPYNSVEGSRSSDNDDNFWFFIGFGLGFPVGCWVIWGILLFKKAWRRAFFLLIDNTWDSFYVIVVLSFRSLKDKISNKSG